MQYTDGDKILCERYNFTVEELNNTVTIWEKMLLLRDLPEPKGWKSKESKKGNVSVKDMAAMMKDSPLLKRMNKFRPPKMIKTKLMIT